MNKTGSLLFAGFLLIAGSMKAQSSESFAKGIIGTWHGTGTLFKQQASFQMTWENSLNSKFIKLTFKNSFEAKPSVERVMDAHAYYQLDQNSGYWFDSRGMMLPLKLEVDQNTLTVLWGDTSSERGKTIYAIDDSDRLSVQDFVLKDDTYVLFGEANYLRVEK